MTAIAAGTGLTPGPGSQFLLFSILSLASILILRRKIRPRPAKGKIIPDYLGQKVRVVKPIPPGGEGNVYYRGAEWIAYSEEPRVIDIWTMVEIVDADGIKLCVRPISETEKQNPNQGGF